MPRYLAFSLALVLSSFSQVLAQDNPVVEPAPPQPNDEELQARKEQVLAALEAALKDVEENGETFEKLDRIGDMYLSLGDPERAIVVFERAIKNFGGTEDLFIKFARVLLLSGRPELGLRTLVIASEAHPESDILQFELGKAYNGSKKYYASISALKKAIELNGEEERYRYYLADVYRTQRKGAKALEIIDALIAEDSDYLPTYLMKGDLLLAQGEYRDAVRHMEDVYEAHPNSKDAKYVLTHAYQQYAYTEATAGRLSRAIKTLESALEVDPENAESRASLGSFYYQAGQHLEAEAVYKEVIRLSPEYLESYVLYGSLLLFLDRKEEAQALFAQGLERAREQGATEYIERYKSLLVPEAS